MAGSGALIGVAAWSMIDRDKETENGYEKTTTYKGNKAYEKYNSKNKNGENSRDCGEAFCGYCKRQ